MEVEIRKVTHIKKNTPAFLKPSTRILPVDIINTLFYFNVLA